jgi:uncharacterized protein (UPF0264 family)
MTRLLISVRSADEAQIAADGGADLVDVKEPSHGSLGAASVDTIRAVIDRLAGRVPLSAALGELLEGVLLPPTFAGQLRYAKFGLAGCSSRADWRTRWQRAVNDLPQQVTPVAVAYADWRAARAPDPESVLTTAQSLGCGAILLDTHDKSAGSLLDHCALADLRRFIQKSRRASLVCVLAGSLGLSEICKIVPLAADYVAVRGAACAGDRGAPIDARRVRRLVALVRRSEPQLLMGQWA